MFIEEKTGVGLDFGSPEGVFHGFFGLQSWGLNLALESRLFEMSVDFISSDFGVEPGPSQSGFPLDFVGFDIHLESWSSEDGFIKLFLDELFSLD